MDYHDAAGIVELVIDRNLNPGDANMDFNTDGWDFGTSPPMGWPQNVFTRAADWANGTNWSNRDMNGDGSTDVSDFNIINAHSFTTAPDPMTPIPPMVVSYEQGTNGTTGDGDIDLSYDPVTGAMTVDTDGAELTCLLIEGPPAVRIDAWTTVGDPPNTREWPQSYFNGKEQWGGILEAAVPDGEYQIATYEPGLSLSDFGTIEFGTVTRLQPYTRGRMVLMNLAEPATLSSIVSGNWNAVGTWDGDDQTPTDADDAVVGSHTVTVTENAAANSVEITEAAGKLVVDAGAVLDLTEGLTMAAGSQLGIGLAGTAPGRIEADGDVSLDGELELRIDGSVPFSAGTYTLISTAEPNAIEGTLLCITDLDAYVSEDVDKDRDELGLVYGDGAVTLTLDKHLNQGDANLDGVTDVRDFNKWNAAKFTNNTDWGRGDFNGDGITDVRDFNKWNAAKFTSATVPPPLVEGQVPEPSVLVLMSVGLLGLVVYGLRRKRLASILTPVSAAEGLLSIS